MNEAGRQKRAVKQSLPEGPKATPGGNLVRVGGLADLIYFSRIRFRVVETVQVATTLPNDKGSLQESFVIQLTAVRTTHN